MNASVKNNQDLRPLAGIVIPTTDNSFFSNLADYAARCLYEEGYTPLILSSANDAETEKSHLRSLSLLGAKGILCVSGLRSLPEDLLPADYPLVWVDRHPESCRSVPLVANDDQSAMALATDYLLEKGCRNILLLPGYQAENRTSPRVLGYEEALRKHGIEPDSAYILHRAGRKSSEAETEELIRDVMGKGIPADAVITSSDRAALGVITALHRVGLYVPEDIKLISFDNSPYSAMASPAITALDRNPRLLAQTACRTLLSLIKGEPVESRTIIPVSLCKRDSTR